MRTIRRRRRAGKTDYKARLGLLKAEKTRLVVRKTNTYILAQLAESETAQDHILLGFSTKDLLSKGWPEEKKGSLKSLSACYLLGFLIGKKAKDKEAILDIGLNRNIHKSRIYSIVKGAIDAGLKIKVNPEVLPDLEFIKKQNEDLFPFIDKLKEKL